MIEIIENSVYKYCETGEWILVGKVVKGIDAYYIEWFN